MNIAEILKECPKGTKLYSPVYGEVELDCVKDDKEYPITCITRKGSYELFTSEGRYVLDYSDAECMLFPSKDQRDWNKFIVPDQVPDQVNDQETEHQFKPFDKVLVRDNEECDWVCNIFSHMDSDNEYVCLYMRWPLCIPYKGNEHLLGTSNKPEQ